MPVIVVANPKGGVGKSTVATNLAGALARAGRAVMLGDVDRQQSARQWLQLRPAALPEIRGWDLAREHIVRPPQGTTHVVLDTPAGLHDKKLAQVLAIADRVLVPLQPSLFDIQATHAFVQEIKAQQPKAKIAVVGNRVKETTVSADQLRHFLDTLGVPVLAMLRDTQLYVQLAARGATLWDVAPSRAERDLAQWAPVLKWAGA
jgi:chromosome partitioning protein